MRPRRDRRQRPRWRRRSANQRLTREERTAATTLGIGSPVAVRRQPSGSGSVLVSNAAKFSSSIRYCVPSLRAARRPERIQRRIVSGFRRVRSAAFGTVSIVVVLYYSDISLLTQRGAEGPHSGA